MLYVGTGDAERARRDRRTATPVAGKILRLTPDGAPAPGNPFPGSPVYSYGHRNVQGLAWDAGGQLYASEFGQNRYDELNRIEAGGNYGWPDVEGTGDDGAFVNPVATWSTSDASPSGIAILDGRVYLACLRGTKLYRIGTDGQGAEALLRRRVRPASATSRWRRTVRCGCSRPTATVAAAPVDTDDRIIRLDPDQI